MISEFCEIQCCGHTGRPGTDDCNLSFVLLRCLIYRCSHYALIFGDEAFEFANGDLLVDILAAAVLFAGVVADSAADGGEWEIFANDIYRP